MLFAFMLGFAWLFCALLFWFGCLVGVAYASPPNAPELELLLTLARQRAALLASILAFYTARRAYSQPDADYSKT